MDDHSASTAITKVTRPTAPPQNPHLIQDGTIKEILRTPSNKITVVTSAMVSVLEVKDIRYDLGVFGEFLKRIPSRLGTNAALDASVKAITTSYASIYSREKPLEALQSYGQGLKALRICLNDPVKVRSADTLCAFYLMVICQVSTVRKHGKW
jgi:hypothetical protein